MNILGNGEMAAKFVSGYDESEIFARQVLKDVGNLGGQLVPIRIGADVTATKEELKTLNGKVAAYEKESSERRKSCPFADVVKGRAAFSEDANMSRNAIEKNSDAWIRRIWPSISVAIRIFGLLILLNARFLFNTIH